MSTRSRPPRTPASAEPKPVMLRGTEFKCSRVNDLLQSALVGEKPAGAVRLNARGIAQPRHVAPLHAVGVANDPEQCDAGELHLDVRLHETRAAETQLGTGRVSTAQPPGPRLERHLSSQGEDPAAIHAPELRVEADREAGVMGWLEVAAADHRIEVPPGERETRQRSDGRVCRDKLSAWRGPQMIHRFDPGFETEGDEGIPSPPAHLEHEPGMVPAQPRGDVDGFLVAGVADIERCAHVATLGELGTGAETQRERNTTSDERPVSGPVARVRGVARPAR